MFQFYNVQQNRPVFGNRITGLNDPAFNTFTKYYTIKEYTFLQKTIITNLEFYVSHSVTNNQEPLNITLELFKNNSVTALGQVFQSDIEVGKHQQREFLNGIEFLENETVKLRLTLNNSYGGHEIFCRLYGNSLMKAEVNALKIKSIDDYNLTPPALNVFGGARFGKSIEALSYNRFTGCQVGVIPQDKFISETMTTLFSRIENGNRILNEGLIVSVDNAINIDINNPEFMLKIPNTSNDSTVFGVVGKYLDNNKYSINTAGAGGIWVTNIGGNISIGDYITTSIFPGYGQKQTPSNEIKNYTIAKCCSIVDWNLHEASGYIYANRNAYKRVFIACTYCC